MIQHPTWYLITHPLGYCPGAHNSIQVLQCKGYNLWSGIVSDIGEITLIAGMISLMVSLFMLYKHHNCAVPRCPRIAHKKYEVKETKQYVCHTHHTQFWHDLLVKQYREDYPEQHALINKDDYER